MELIRCSMRLEETQRCGKPASAFYVVFGMVGHGSGAFKLVALCRAHAGRVPKSWDGEWEYREVERAEWLASLLVHSVHSVHSA